MMRWIVGAVLGLGLLVGQAARAQTCLVSASGVAFGTYDPVTSSPTVSTGSISVTCQALVNLALSYTIQVGTGGGGGFSSRAMAAGAGRLNYQVYTNSLRSTIWGDGTSGTGVVSDSYGLLALGNTTRNYPIYGSITAGQVVPPGAYTDVVAVLIVY